MVSVEPPACTDCGACCVCEHGAALYAELTREEARAGKFSSTGVHHDAVLRTGSDLDPVWGLRTKMVEVQRGPLAGVQRCVCTFLTGDPLAEVSCVVYPDRPEVCIGFRRGGPGCKAVLARASKLVLA